MSHMNPYISLKAIYLRYDITVAFYRCIYQIKMKQSVQKRSF